MILVLYNIILITNFKLIEMCIKSSPKGRDPNGIKGRWETLKYLTRWKKISNGSEENFSTVRNLRAYGRKEIFHKGKFSSDRRKI